MANDERGRRTNNPGKDDKAKPDIHPAGPHATKELTNEDATPGAGSLPDDQDARNETGGTG